MVQWGTKTECRSLPWGDQAAISLSCLLACWHFLDRVISVSCSHSPPSVYFPTLSSFFFLIWPLYKQTTEVFVLSVLRCGAQLFVTWESAYKGSHRVIWSLPYRARRTAGLQLLVPQQGPLILVLLHTCLPLRQRKGCTNSYCSQTKGTMARNCKENKQYNKALKVFQTVKATGVRFNLLGNLRLC